MMLLLSSKKPGFCPVAVLILLAGFVMGPNLRAWAVAQQSGQPPAEQGISPAELDELLAPVALYPDALLVQVLMCSTSPYQIGAVNAWLSENQHIKGSELQEAAQAEGFDPSFVALVPFRQIVSMLAGDMDWTRRLGEVFSGERKAVFDSVQRLRAKAQSVGNLTSTSQQEVKTETIESGQDVIVIQPANPQVIYVPQYNPQVVYIAPPQQTTTTVIVEDDHSDEIAAAAIGFTAGIIIGATVNNYSYWGPYGWYGGAYWRAEAWDDYYDHREDMREDRYDNREDIRDDRSDRREDTTGERSDRVDDRQTSRESTAATNRSDRQTSRDSTAAANRSDRQTSRESSAATNRSQGSRESGRASTRPSDSNYEARGYSNSRSSQMSRQRSGSSSGAFSGYGSRNSTRASSTRGRSSMSSRGGRGRRR